MNSIDKAFVDTMETLVKKIVGPNCTGGQLLTLDELNKLDEAWTAVKMMLPTEDMIVMGWDVSDVRQCLEDNLNLPEDFLTTEQCREVLRKLEDEHDANVGINWEQIEWAIESLFEEEIEQYRKDNE